MCLFVVAVIFLLVFLLLGVGFLWVLGLFVFVCLFCLLLGFVVVFCQHNIFQNARGGGGGVLFYLFVLCLFCLFVYFVLFLFCFLLFDCLLLCVFCVFCQHNTFQNPTRTSILQVVISLVSVCGETICERYSLKINQ